MPSSSPAVRLRQAASRGDLAQGTYYYDRRGHALYVCLFPGSEPWVAGWGSGARDRPDPPGSRAVHGGRQRLRAPEAVRLGQRRWADSLRGRVRRLQHGAQAQRVPGSVVRDCTVRWAGADVGMGGGISGFERHTADRVKRPELHVDHCVFDCSNSFLFDGNDNPTKNIPFANHRSGSTATSSR